MTKSYLRLHLIRIILILFTSHGVNAQNSLPDFNTIPELCSSVGEQNVAHHLKGIYSMAIERWSAKQIAEFHINIDKKNLGTHAWILSMGKMEKFRNAAFLIQLYSMYLLTKKYSLDIKYYDDLSSWEKFFNDAQHASSYSAENLNKLKKTLRILERNKDYDKKLRSLKIAAPAFCQNLACIEGLKNVINFTHPKNLSYGSGQYAVSFSQNYFNILTQEKFQQGLAINSLKILQKIKYLQDDVNFDLSHDFFYDDLVNSFKEAGLNQIDAENFALEILGIYGSRGASIQYLERFADSNNFKTIVMLQFNFVATSLLDFYKQSQNNNSLYTLPKEIKTQCDFGKPYHFWMSAYLTHKLQKKFLKKSSAQGTHLMGNLYESINNITHGRDKIIQPFIDDLFSVHNNSIRMGITYRDLGIFWMKNKQSDFNLDHLLYDLMKKTKKVSERKITRIIKNQNPYTIYQAWNSMFQADYLFQKYL
jgi:hypothetical protein